MRPFEGGGFIETVDDPRVIKNKGIRKLNNTKLRLSDPLNLDLANKYTVVSNPRKSRSHLPPYHFYPPFLPTPPHPKVLFIA